MQGIDDSSISTVQPEREENWPHSDEIEHFHSHGYMVLPGYLSSSWNERILKVLKEAPANGPRSKALLPNPLIDDIVFDDRVLDVVRLVLGECFLFHHANGQALPHTDMGKPWHHDHDSAEPWVEGAPAMVHLMGYPLGLDEAVGPLVLLPGSHRAAVDRGYPCQFGIGVLPGEVAITGGPGLLVVLNSSTWHARRPNRSARIRYYYNLSYCQFGVTRTERSQYEHMLRGLRSAATGQNADLVGMLTQIKTLVREPLL